MRLIALVLFVVYGTILYRMDNVVKFDDLVQVTYSKVLHDSIKQKLATHLKLCDLKMKGKHLYMFNKNTLYVSYLVIKERGKNINSFVIEEWYNDRWNIIFKGNKIGGSYIIKFNNIISGNVRFKVLKSHKIPIIESFQIYTAKRHTCGVLHTSNVCSKCI